MKSILRYSLLILFSIFIIGIGYASISSISLEIEGDAALPGQDGIFISNIQYTSNVAADLDNSTINTYYQTLLGNKTTLSTSNANSSITYTITIQNDYADKYVFRGIEYDPSFYDNNNIEITTTGFVVGDTVDANDSVTFTITFKYKSGVTPSSSNNVLNSYVNFAFEKYTWVDVCDSTSIYLSCRIISQTASSDSSINYSSFSSSSNGRGLYYTSDLTKTEDLDNDGDGEVVYYYRGNVTNNYVRFDSYCWRIVRTNEDGSIRLIYGGTPNNGNCPQTGSTASIGNSAFNTYNNNGYDNIYFGYMYGTRGANNYTATHTNTNNSTIKRTIDNWYNNNLADSASYLADYPFCNDRTLGTGNGYGTSTTEYATQLRFYGSVSNQIPTYKCNQANDKFTVSSSVGNGALTNKIGLLSADEAVFAGAPYATSGNNTDCYLYTAANWWLMSPGDVYNRGIYIYEITNAGLMRMITASTTSIGTRPVINLLPYVTVSGGTGAYNNPYIVNGIDNINYSGATAPEGNKSVVVEKPVVEETEEEVEDTTQQENEKR